MSQTTMFNAIERIVNLAENEIKRVGEINLELTLKMD